MDLSIYDVILRPMVTEKAYKINRDQKKLVVLVHPQANKPLVARAIEQLFDAKVEQVRIVVRQGKVRKVGRNMTKGPKRKIAIVSLAEGYSLDLFSQTGAPAVAERIASEEKV